MKTTARVATWTLCALTLVALPTLGACKPRTDETPRPLQTGRQSPSEPQPNPIFTVIRPQ